MESHAVSGQKIEKPTNLKQKTKPQQPNQKTQPKNQTNLTTPRPCLKEETQRAAQAYWETLQKGSLLFISMQPSRIFLSGHRTSWDGKWSCPEVDLNASIYRPEFSKLLLPSVPDTSCEVSSSWARFQCTSKWFTSHSSTLTLERCNHMALDAFALGWERNV